MKLLNHAVPSTVFQLRLDLGHGWVIIYQLYVNRIPYQYPNSERSSVLKDSRHFTILSVCGIGSTFLGWKELYMQSCFYWPNCCYTNDHQRLNFWKRFLCPCRIWFNRYVYFCFLTSRPSYKYISSIIWWDNCNCTYAMSLLVCGWNCWSVMYW